MFKPLYPLFDKSKTTYEIVGFDCETIHKRVTYHKNNPKSKEVTGDQNIFYQGGLYSDDEYKSYLDKHEMIKDLLSPKYVGKLIVATNLGFDFNALFFHTKYWSKFKIIYSGSRLLCAIYYLNDEDKITFLDTGNYLPLSVNQMGGILNIPKLDSPKCLGKIPVDDEELKELITYNKRDCEISKKFLELIQHTINLLGGQLKITIASSSMDLYRRKYHRFIMKHETEILEDENYYEDFLFNAYYGGRTEAFCRGKITSTKKVQYNVYDINSLYPSVMLKSFPHPMSVRKIFNPSLEMLDYYLKYKGVMQVKIKSPKYMKYPYLPHKYTTSNGKKLVFPLGQWSGTYTNFEIKRAIELGYEVLEIKKVYIYKNSFFPFREFVEDLYKKRLEFKSEGSPLELGVKLLLNSQYGKWGQRRISEVDFIDLENMTEQEHNDFTFGLGKDIKMSDNKLGIETTTTTCDSSFVFPVIPIHVTAYARDLLYKYITENNALYCDTDSILTTDTLPEEPELGKMKVEYKVISGIVIKPKMYMYQTPKKVVARLKGVSRMNKEKFYQVLRGEMVSYMKFTKTKESIRRGIVPNTIIKTSKFIDLEDNKRVWSKPFNIFELQVSEPLVIDD